MSMLHIMLCAVIGYFMGCFSTGIILGDMAKIDIRKYGSKSTGTTNVIRVMGFK
ncbi:MAG: glycerol-3-phosphate acyltransferase, partial [Clostridiales bacterium]|nr:glycerol-3-phosphate acyltransferase [Clostridiales bacterium]